jgi:hypothetical protein
VKSNQGIPRSYALCPWVEKKANEGRREGTDGETEERMERCTDHLFLSFSLSVGSLRVCESR